MARAKDMPDDAADDMMVVTTPYVSGMRVERVIGMAWGTVVRSRGIGYQVVAGLRAMAGGEIDEYTDMLNHARRHALERLRKHARSLGANAVISASFDSSEFGQSMSEILAFGTAVVVAPEDGQSSPVRLV